MSPVPASYDKPTSPSRRFDEKPHRTLWHAAWTVCSMMARCARIFVAVLLIASLRPARAEATEWFVASGGTGPGTRTAPLGRVQDGLSSAMPGDIVTVRTGTYVEALRTVRSGTEDAPITVKVGEREIGIYSVNGKH